MSVLRMTDLDLRGKRVLIREDLNVPVKEGRITSEQRIKAALPTLRLALEKGAAVMVTSHLGRPTEGVWSEADSLAPVAARLSELLGLPVPVPGNRAYVLTLLSARGTPIARRFEIWDARAAKVGSAVPLTLRWTNSVSAGGMCQAARSAATVSTLRRTSPTNERSANSNRPRSSIPSTFRSSIFRVGPTPSRL